MLQIDARAATRSAQHAARRLPPYRVYKRANWLLTKVPGAGLLRTGPKTAQWAVKALIRSRAASANGDGVPTARPTPALTAQVALDEAVLGLMMRPSKFPSTADYERVGEELAEAAALYRARGWVDDPAAYHRTPPPLERPGIVQRRWLTDRYEHVVFESGYEPSHEEPAHERWLGYEAPKMAHAYILRHDDDRPWLVCLHGFGMGFVAADFFAFKVPRLHHDLGLNLAFPVMPLHGQRTVPGANDLLSFDLMNTVFGLTQAVWDTRRLLSWIRAQTDQPVGMYGISLGGYTGALLSTLEPLDLAIAGIPAVDFPELFRHHAPNRVERAARNQGLLGVNATDVHRVISPIARPSLVPPDRRFIYAGLGDRMVPPPQPRALWEHWERPPIVWYPGDHVGFLWARKAHDFVADSLRSSGFAVGDREPVLTGG